MNTENTTESRAKLEKLSPEQKSYIVELSRKATLDVMVDALKEHGIDTSPSSLSRFIRKRRGEELVEAGQDVAGAAEALAEQGRGGKLREGTLEVLRQSFFEKAANGQSVEEARELYDALVKEEARVKELELEARKVAALEQQVKLQERRIEVEAMKARAVLGRVKGEVVGSQAVGDDGKEVKELKEGEGSVGSAMAGCTQGEPPKGGTTCALVVGDVAIGSGVAACADGEPPKGGTTCALVDSADGLEQSQRAKVELGGPTSRFIELVEEALGILNRGGTDVAERIVEARGLLEEAVAGLR